jgi:SNF2 family DNA or RNA helicase
MRQKTELRPYQEDIATFLYEHNEALAVARPGYGKTVAALTAFLELKRDGVVRHALVIAPKRVARNVWPDEIKEWAHTKGLSYEVLSGPPGERRLQLLRACDRDLTIVGVDIAQWLMDEIDYLSERHPTTAKALCDLLIIDEISRFRNPTGKRAKEVAKRAQRWKMIWGLTGTLRPNGPEDMFMPARIVTRDKLWGRSFYKWQKEHFYPTDRFGYTWAPLPGHEDTLSAEIAPHIITPGDATLQLPKLSIVLDHVDLPSAARMEYDRMEKKLFAKDGDTLITAASAGVATGKLAQAANGFMYDNSKAVVALHDEKREWLADLVEEGSEPLLIIYEFIEDLEMIREVCGDIPYLGAGVSDRTSTGHINQWNAGAIPVMAMHPASGGHGLNLQAGGADMAWISPCWSPEYWEQTIARLHRSGQTRPVVVRVCVARETVDELKLSRVHDKTTAQAAFEKYLRRRQAALSQ